MAFKCDKCGYKGEAHEFFVDDGLCDDCHYEEHVLSNAQCHETEWFGWSMLVLLLLVIVSVLVWG